MNKWKIRTKIEVGFGIIVVLMLLSVTIIPALTRTITSSSDTMDTYIRNSNGNYWAATGANLQLAINDVGDNGWVKCPSGKITLTDNLDINNVVNFSLIGMNTELEIATPSSYTGSSMISLYQSEYILIEGFELDGKSVWNVSSKDNGGGVKLRNTNFSTVRNCHIHNVMGDGIVISDDTAVNKEPSRGNIFTHNFIHHIGNISDTASGGDAGIRIMGESDMCDNEISYNRIEYIREHGIKVYGSGATYGYHNRNKIIGNHIAYTNMADWDSDGATYGSGIVAGGNDTLVEGNTILFNKLMESGIGISFNGGKMIGNTIEYIEAPYDARYAITATDGVLRGSTYNGSLICNNIINGNNFIYTYGISVSEGAYHRYPCNLIVDGNIIRDISGLGITVESANYSSFCHNIINNTGGDAINIDTSRNCHVDYNIIYDSGDEGIGITSCINCSFDHNTIQKTAGRGMDVSGTNKYNSISHNKIGDITTYGIEFKTTSSFDYFDISHNMIVSSDTTCFILDNVENSTIAFNTLVGFTKGFYEYSDCHLNIFVGNNAKGCTTPWDTAGSNDVNSSNIPTFS